MADSVRNRELVQLVLAAYAGEATDMQLDQLDLLLKTEVSARDLYTDLMILQAQIGWSAINDTPDCGFGQPVSAAMEATRVRSTERDQACSEQPSGRNTSHDSSSGWASASAALLAAITRSPIAIAAILVLMFGLWWSQREVQDLRGQLADHATSNVAVAYLANASGCDWGNGPLRLHTVGSAVDSSDDVTLYEGMAEFRLANGVVVNVEAPASLVINSSSSLVLLYGKLTLHVPWEAAEFRVIAGPCQFAANDADFGVNHQGSRLEVHAFSGEVRATSPSVFYSPDVNEKTLGGQVVTDDTGIFGRAVITAGSAISLVMADDVVKVDKMGFRAAPELFAAKLSMSGALPASGAYARAVLASRPVGYWRFEKVQDGHIANEVPGGVDLKVVGDLRLAGQPNDLAAEFRPGVDCYLASDQPVTGAENVANYSVEVWIKPSYVHVGGFASLVSDEPNYHGSRLEIQGSPMWPNSGVRGARHPATVRYVHHNLAFTRLENGFTECFSKERYLVRRWQHVVAVKERSSMRLYLDGQLAASARDKSPLSLHSRLAVGQDTLHHAYMRNFVGQIDEVAFYNRALSADEIVTHFQAPNWDRQSQAKPNSGI